MAEKMDFSFRGADDDENDIDQGISEPSSHPVIARSERGAPGDDRMVYDWPTEDLTTLCTRIRQESLCVRRATTLPFNKVEAKLDWEKVAFSAYSSHDCRIKWQQLSTNVRKYRTLSELVSDAEQWLLSAPRKPKLAFKDHPDKPTRPVAIFIRYMMEELPKMKAKYPQLSQQEVVSKIGEKYKKISPEKLAKLRAAWQHELKEYQARLDGFYADHPDAAPRSRSATSSAGANRGGSTGTAFAHFVTEQRENPKFAHATKEQLREKWTKLKDEQKIMYIEIALDAHRRRENQTSMLLPKTTRDVLSKDERDLYDRFLGKPERPPPNGFALFKSIAAAEEKGLSTTERNKQIHERWTLMSREDQNKFNNETKIMRQQFEKQMAQYLETLKKREQMLIRDGPRNNNKPIHTPTNGEVEHKSGLKRMRFENPNESSIQRSTKNNDNQSFTGSLSTIAFSHESISAATDASPHKSADVKTTPKLTALHWFQQCGLEEWRTSNPGCSDKKILSAMAEEFEGLSEKKKAKWARRAEAENQRRKAMVTGVQS